MQLINSNVIKMPNKKSQVKQVENHRVREPDSSD